MKPVSDLLHAESSGDVKQKISGAKSADELVKAANDAGYHADKNSLAYTMRSIAGAELQKRGFPDWAINSVFLGETVCW